MLKLKYLFENYSLAKEALKNWEYDADTLDDMLSQFRISSNAIYPFYQNGKVRFLRLIPVEEKTEKNISGEMAFVEFLNRRGYPALKPVKAKSGDIFLRINTQWGDYYAMVSDRVNGVPIENMDFPDEIVFRYGEALGNLHALSSEYAPENKKWTHTEVLEWIEAELRACNAKDDIMAELYAIKKELGKLPVRKDNYGLIHYDFEPDNVFYDKESGSCPVIDFDDSMYHWYALDIEKVFESLRDELSGIALGTAQKVFIDGYRTGHCYTEAMKAAQPLMRRFINLYSYTRLIHSVAEKLSDEPAWLADLRGKLDKIIAEKEAAIAAPIVKG